MDELFGIIEETKLHFQQSFKKVPPKQKSNKPGMETIPLYRPKEGYSRGPQYLSMHLKVP